jgi:hypothetical protein
MPTDAPLTSVTRREFYSSQGVVWFYMLVLMGNSLRGNRNWPDVALFALALASSLFYSFKASRESRR